MHGNKVYSYDTLSEAINGLKERGYTHDFNIKSDAIECNDIEIELRPEAFEIDEVYRFEGNSNPDDEEVVYAIRSLSGIKGVLVDAFGTYAADVSSELISKLKYAFK